MKFTIPPDVGKALFTFADVRKKAIDPIYGQCQFRLNEDRLEVYTCWNGRHLARWTQSRVNPEGYTSGMVHASAIKEGGEITFEKFEADTPMPRFWALHDRWSRNPHSYWADTGEYRVENAEDLALFGKLGGQVSFTPVSQYVSRWSHSSTGVGGFTTHNTRLPWLTEKVT